MLHSANERQARRRGWTILPALLLVVGCTEADLDEARESTETLAKDLEVVARDTAKAAADRVQPLASRVEQEISEIDVTGWAETLHERSMKADEEFLATYRPDDATIAAAGARLHREFLELLDLPDDEDLPAQGTRVLARLRESRPGPFTLTVFDYDLPVAFTHCGGHIYLSTGLLELEPTDDELAFLLGHEMAHNLEEHTIRSLAYTERMRHSLARAAEQGAGAALDAAEKALGSTDVDRDAVGERAEGVGESVASATNVLTQMIYYTVALGFSEELEREADVRGMELAIGAGYEPSGAASAMRKLHEATSESAPPPPHDTNGTVFEQILTALDSHFASHPPDDERIAYLEELAHSSS